MAEEAWAMFERRRRSPPSAGAALATALAGSALLAVGGGFAPFVAWALEPKAHFQPRLVGAAPRWRREVLRRAATASPTSAVEDVPTAAGEDMDLLRLQKLAKQGLAVEAEDAMYAILDRGETPTRAHYAAMVDACTPTQDIDRAERWLFRMGALGVEADMDVYNAILRMSAEICNPKQAVQWVDEAREAGLEPDLESHRSVLRAMRKAGTLLDIEVWAEQMMNDGFQLDASCVGSLVGAFAEQQKMRKAEEWLAFGEQSLGKEGMDVEVYNTAIKGYLRQGNPTMAEETLRRLEGAGLQPTAGTYTLLTGDGSTYRDPAVVRHWAQLLLESGVELDADAYTSVIGALVSIGDAQGAEDWFSRMVEAGLQNSRALAMVVDGLMLEGGEEGAETAEEWINQVQETGVEPTPALYAALASADVQRGDFELVEARMQQMEADGLHIDEDALVALLLAYANAVPQQTQLAEQMFKQQMLQGRILGSRRLYEALRAAVGGLRCLQLRRELQLTTSEQAKAELKGNMRGDMRLKKPAHWYLIPRKSPAWKQLQLEPPAEQARVLSWE